MSSINNLVGLIDQLLPKVQPWQTSSWWGSKKSKTQQIAEFMSDLMNQKAQMTLDRLKFDKTVSDKVAGQGMDYNKYFEFPNVRLANLAKAITKGLSTDTEKMYAVEQWVNENIEYELDITNYRMGEYWAYPTETLNHGDGDCEDMAFLISSLALHAGVDSDRVRMYGGFVRAGTGAQSSYSLAGHGWGAFKRDDGEWVAIEGSYYPTDTPIDERTPMRQDLNYVEDFWYVTKDGVINSIWRNYIRNPGTGFAMIPYTTTGSNINIRV